MKRHRVRSLLEARDLRWPLLVATWLAWQTSAYAQSALLLESMWVEIGPAQRSTMSAAEALMQTPKVVKLVGSKSHAPGTELPGGVVVADCAAPIAVAFGGNVNFALVPSVPASVPLRSSWGGSFSVAGATRASVAFQQAVTVTPITASELTIGLDLSAAKSLVGFPVAQVPYFRWTVKCTPLLTRDTVGQLNQLPAPASPPRIAPATAQGLGNLPTPPMPLQCDLVGTKNGPFTNVHARVAPAIAWVAPPERIRVRLTTSSGWSAQAVLEPPKPWPATGASAYIDVAKNVVAMQGLGSCSASYEVVSATVTPTSAIKLLP